MRNQLDKHLLPTIDMKKAIERNAKHEGDLSLALKKIDIEKRLALEQLSRKREAVKIQMFKKRETLSKQFKVQLFEQGSLESISRPRPNVGLQKSPVRRSWSYEGTSHSSKPHPLELRKDSAFHLQLFVIRPRMTMSNQKGRQTCNEWNTFPPTERMITIVRCRRINFARNQKFPSAGIHVLIRKKIVIQSFYKDVE